MARIAIELNGTKIDYEWDDTIALDKTDSEIGMILGDLVRMFDFKLDVVADAMKTRGGV